MPSKSILFVFTRIVAICCAAKAILPRQSLQIANNATQDASASYTGTSNATNPTISPSPTCCMVVADGVGLNFWWNSSYEATVATVITNYIKYDNTVIPGNVTTIYNHSATQSLYGTNGYILRPDVPESLAQGPEAAAYGITSVLKGTEVVIDGRTITSPTAFAQFERVAILTGAPFRTGPDAPWVCYTESTAVYSSVRDRTTTFPVSTEVIPTNPAISAGSLVVGASLGFYLDPVFIDTDLSQEIIDNEAYEAVIEVPQALINYMASIPSVTQAWPYVASCYGYNQGLGAPSVHVPVNELTNTLSNTIVMGGLAPGTGSSPPAQPRPGSALPTIAPMPKPTNQPSPVHSSTPVESPTYVGVSSTALTPAPAESPGGEETTSSNDPGGSSLELGGGISDGPNGSSGSGSSGGGTGGSSASEPESGDSGGPGIGGSSSSGTPDSGQFEGIGGSQSTASVISSVSKQRGSPSQVSAGSAQGHTGPVSHPDPYSSSGPESTHGSLGSIDWGQIFGSENSAPESVSGLSFSSPVSDHGIYSSPSIELSGSSGAAPGATINLPAGGTSIIPAVVGSSGAIILPNSQTVSPGEAGTYSGLPISIPATEGRAFPSAVIIGSGSRMSTVSIVVPGGRTSLPQSISVGGHGLSYSILPSDSGIVLGNGKTILPGAAAQTINGVPVSLAAGGSALAVESSTISLGSSSPQQTVQVGGSAMPISYVPSSGGILLPNGQTLHPGSSAMINGVPVSLSPSENGLQVGSSSISLEGPLVSASDASQSLTIDDRIIPISFASNGAGIILPDGQTLAAGQSSNIDGVPVHLASGGSYIVEGSSTIPLGTPLATQSITFGSSIVPVSLLPNGEGIVLPNDLTIHPGQNTVVYGLAASLAPGDNAVVVNGTTQVLQPGSPTTDVGNYIASGIGYSNTSAGTGSFTIPSSTPGSTVQAAGSDAERKFRLERSLWVSIALLGALALW